MTREEAQKEVIAEIKKMIESHGEDDIMMMAPQTGKNSWTYKECLESAINDTPLDGYGNSEGSKLIDMHLRYAEYRKERLNKKN